MLSSRYSCSSSIDDDARVTVLSNVGDCEVFAPCVTSYNQYFGGWATVVDGAIVDGDLTPTTKDKFSVKFLTQESTYASAFWRSQPGVVLPYMASPIPLAWSGFPSTTNLSGFTIEDNTGIKAQISGTYFVSYSVTVLSTNSQSKGWFLNNGDTTLKAYAPSRDAANPYTVSGSCIFHVSQNEYVTLNSAVGGCTVFSASITIRLNAAT